MPVNEKSLASPRSYLGDRFRRIQPKRDRRNVASKRDAGFRAHAYHLGFAHGLDGEPLQGQAPHSSWDRYWPQRIRCVLIYVAADGPRGLEHIRNRILLGRAG